MPPLDDRRLLAVAQKLQAAGDIAQLLQVTGEEIRESLGYRAAWIAVFDLDARVCRVLAATGLHDQDIWASAAVLPIDTDPYVSRLLVATGPEIVEDAQTDPNVNREVVEALGNRTVVNVPLRLLDQPFGMLGTGTFGDEGVRVPTEEEISYLVGLAGQLVVASARILLVRQREEAARQRAELDRKLAQRQRLESLGQLAGGIAHDFNNLLTVISASASLLGVDERERERLEELRFIREAVARGAELTRRLLALGHRQSLILAPIDGNGVLTNVVAMLRRVIPADIAIELALDSSLPAILAEASQIEQVLVNLCLNARDAMPAGGRITITSAATTLSSSFVSEHPLAREGRYVLITVSDNGTGMPREVLERVFEPFFTTKPEGRGTGLGLAVSRGIIEQHGGLIDVDSEPGVGTAFKLYLPVTDRTATARDHELAAPAREGTEAILVADDDPEVRRAIVNVLSRAGYNVTGVTNGT